MPPPRNHVIHHRLHKWERIGLLLFLNICALGISQPMRGDCTGLGMVSQSIPLESLQEAWQTIADLFYIKAVTLFVAVINSDPDLVTL